MKAFEKMSRFSYVTYLIFTVTLFLGLVSSATTRTSSATTIGDVGDSTAPPLIETTAGQMETTAGQIETTAGQIETTAGQMETTAGQIETTAGQIETTAGQISTLDPSDAVTTQAATVPDPPTAPSITVPDPPTAPSITTLATPSAPSATQATGPAQTTPYVDQSSTDADSVSTGTPGSLPSGATESETTARTQEPTPTVPPSEDGLNDDQVIAVAVACSILGLIVVFAIGYVFYFFCFRKKPSSQGGDITSLKDISVG